MYARRTSRCTEPLTELGFALRGKAAAALSTHLGLQSSRMTILRILRQTPSLCAKIHEYPVFHGNLWLFWTTIYDLYHTYRIKVSMLIDVVVLPFSRIGNVYCLRAWFDRI